MLLKESVFVVVTVSLFVLQVFDVIPDRDLREARTRANPYETIGGAFFQNRAAMKVANLDKVFDFLLSGETEKNLLVCQELYVMFQSKNPLVSERPNFNCDREAPLFYFADVCAGPGGFSEYILWRKAFYNAKGFGFTLKGKDDFKLGKFTASSAHYFEPYYGEHGDGDVMNPVNINSLEKFIMKGTNDVGVDLMMADGGFSVEGSENIQEILSKRLYLCQLLVSLCIVRENGTFFCKLFDIFTPFSAGLVYLMHVAYNQVSLHKPHTSRPANSERYIICKGLRKNYSDAIRDYLKRLVLVYLIDHIFLFRIAVRQSTYLRKYLTYAKNNSLIDKDQGTLRDDCLKYWLVPNKTLNRGAERYQIDPEQYFGRFTRKVWHLHTIFYVVVLRALHFSDLMRIPDRTVLLVDKHLETVAVDGLIRILDAAVINGDDVSGLLYSKRMAAAQKFCKALQLVSHSKKFLAFTMTPTCLESWKMGWSCSKLRNYAFSPSQPTLGSFFEQQWEE
ncbi:unnamed protein product [Angiostrongylus costaricensis]|uniref:Cap-specific mRNA (nucleoside-2'-O-)-methyltransferase 1 n=1 Tax=Angiostrongylus costaricensis TaxID=334426 RepID=A0A0R3PPD9_ANGCS|nr:unnamed protein product [Angiostrongylus costaricensis]